MTTEKVLPMITLSASAQLRSEPPNFFPVYKITTVGLHKSLRQATLIK